jgi:hypothetical protein
MRASWTHQNGQLFMQRPLMIVAMGCLNRS